MELASSRNHLYNKTYRKTGGRNNKGHLTADSSKSALHKAAARSNVLSKAHHTCSSKNLSLSKDQQRERTHETALRSELQKFRAEIESRFRSSEANGSYTFPRVNNLKEDAKPFVLQHDCTCSGTASCHCSREHTHCGTVHTR